MLERKCSISRHALAIVVTLGVAFCSMAPCARADGVSFGVGVGVGTGYGPPPPAYVPARPAYQPPPEEDVYGPPPVVVERAVPAAVYPAPVVVERRSSVYYYYPVYRSYYSHRVETRTDYYGAARYREDDYEY